jgi:hypothetical protein
MSFSLHRCSWSAAAITLPTAVSSGPQGIASREWRGTAWPANREFETQPSTFTAMSSGATATPVGPVCRSR